MKSILLLTLFLSLSATSWAQTLIWSKNISSPIPGAIPRDLSCISKNSAACSVIINWFVPFEGTSQQVIWFGWKGLILHTEVLNSSDSNADSAWFDSYGISHLGLVLLEKSTFSAESGTTEKTSFLVFTLKTTPKGRVVTKASFPTSTNVTSYASGHGDNVGFFTVEKVSGDIWIIQRYIY